MTKTSFSVLCLFVASVSASAIAATNQPAPVEESSPALQLARRVAAMENSKDLPSRAVTLGQRAAKNSKLALRSPGTPKKKKKPTSIAE